MPKTVKSQLSDLLAETLDKEVASPTKATQKAARPERESKKAGVRKPRNTSLVLRVNDMDAIDAILDIVREQTGERGSIIDAVRIGLDLCPLDKARIKTSFERLKSMDRRKKADR